MEQLINTTSLFDLFQNIFPYMWGPTSEPDLPGAFLTDIPKNILNSKKQKNLNWIAGVVRNEGLVITSGKSLFFYSKILIILFQIVVETCVIRC